MIAMALRGGAKSKIGEARFGKCRLTITPPEFSKVRERRIFRRKKLAGEDPLDPLVEMGMASFGSAGGSLSQYFLIRWAMGRSSDCWAGEARRGSGCPSKTSLWATCLRALLTD